MAATCYLLDVNVLIALVDPQHVHHEVAHAWFAKTGHKAWATCPLTENGLLRIVGHARYPNSPGHPGTVAALLSSLRALPGHRFWPDSVSLTDPARFDPERLLDPSQVTDSYLLGLAVAQGGKLASLDRKLVVDAVRGGRAALQLI
jgi:toxin-antitoxin system PIN domain toxin